MTKTPTELVTIGFIQKAHGIRGEVKVKPLTDHPARFGKLKSVFVESKDGLRREMRVSKARISGDTIILQFENIETRTDAEDLRGTSINISSKEVLPLPEDRFYHFEVIGFQVKTSDGALLGKVAEVLDLPANAVFVVKNNAQEHLIPAIKDVIKDIDKEAREIRVELLDGLLD